MNVLAIAESLTETQLKQFKANVLLGANSWNPYADRVGSKIFQIWLFDHYSLFRSRKPSKTSLQRESLTIETNDIIGDHQVSDHYTANSTVCFANFSQVLPPNSSSDCGFFDVLSHRQSAKILGVFASGGIGSSLASDIHVHSWPRRFR